MKPFLVRVSFQAGLRIAGGRLLADGEPGLEVHAASFLRERRIVLDSTLLADPPELRRIWIHEVFHFVWWRMGNTNRVDWEKIVRREMRARVPGELGWSAEWRKAKLSPLDVRARNRRWREYCSESFCDSAAWLLVRIRRHPEFTLPRKNRDLRRLWLENFLRYNNG